jgi:HlyD family secretion protein
VETTKATLTESFAMLESAKRNVEVAQAAMATIQTRIDDATLRSPVTGRVLYRLAEAGEVLAAGGKALTLVNLEDIYMEIFLPSEQAASLAVGAEGRITVDYDQKHAVAGRVSFVSPEAQFTPKQVETKSEREKLMFRVKIQLPKDLASRHLEQIKTGVRGVGYVKLKDSAVWPASLQDLIEPQTQGPVVMQQP